MALVYLLRTDQALCYFGPETGQRHLLGQSACRKGEIPLLSRGDKIMKLRLNSIRRGADLALMVIFNADHRRN